MFSWRNIKEEKLHQNYSQNTTFNIWSSEMACKIGRSLVKSFIGINSAPGKKG